MASLDKITEVNILCQRNFLNFKFSKIHEINQNDPKNKSFVVKLKIKNPKTSASVDYYGQATTVQLAKHKAANKAIADNFLLKLVNKINLKSSNKVSKVNPLPNLNSKINNLNQEQNGLPKQNGLSSKQTASINPTSNKSSQKFNNTENQIKINYLDFDVRSFQKAIAPIIIPKPLSNNNLIIRYDKNIEPNYIYGSYLIAKKFNLNIDIQMINNLTNKVTIKFKIGDKSFLGTSTSEYEAMQIAARQFNSNMFSINDNQIKDTIDDSNVYLKQLNEIHLKLNESLDLKSILLIDKVKDPLSIYKAQLGKLISFGIGSTTKEAQNDAAKKLLESFKNKLDADILDLDKELAQLKIKKMKLNEILQIMGRFDAKILTKKRRKLDNGSNDMRMDVELENNS